MRAPSSLVEQALTQIACRIKDVESINELPEELQSRLLSACLKAHTFRPLLSSRSSRTHLLPPSEHAARLYCIAWGACSVEEDVHSFSDLVCAAKGW